MKRIPLVPTMLVLLALAIMIGLGLWQLRRAEWKDALIQRYSNADQLPPIALPAGPLAGDPPLFRWATANCVQPVPDRVTAGANREGESGYVHIVRCSSGTTGRPIAVELGWAKDPRAKFEWAGGPVTGVIAPDRDHGIRLVAASAPPGLQPSAKPSLDAIPQNHRMYALTWFAFAAIALVIYILALRRRA